jgi:hypothetical protein
VEPYHIGLISNYPYKTSITFLNPFSILLKFGLSLNCNEIAKKLLALSFPNYVTFPRTTLKLKYCGTSVNLTLLRVNANAWVQTHDLRFTAYITSVFCNRLLLRINYEEKISSRMRFELTRSMVRLQCRGELWLDTHAGDSIFKWPQEFSCSLDLCLSCNKVI